MIGSFSEDENVAWPSYVDFLSVFSIILVLFAGYMAFLLSNGMSDTRFRSDVQNAQGRIHNAYANFSSNQMIIPLGDTITFESGCPAKPDCKERELNADQVSALQKKGKEISQYYSHATHVSVQGRADKEPGSNQYKNMEVAGARAFAVFKTLDQCDDCSNSFRKKLRIANVGDKEAIGIGPEFRTVVLVLDYSKD